MKRLALLFIFLPTIALADPCDLAGVLTQIRPGATYTVRGNTYAGITWQDVVQIKPTQAEIDAQVATCQSDYATGQAYINQAKAKFADANQSNIDPKLFRAVILVAIDEINALRDRDAAQDAAVAAATSLSDLKTRWAALPAMPDRTPAQAKTAILNKLDSGAAN